MEDKKEQKPTIVKDEKEQKPLSDIDKKNFLEQIKNLRKTQDLLKMGNFGGIKSEYKFWSTQPVPQLNRDCKIDFGPINNEKNMELYNKYRELALKEQKIVFGGRLGEYKYYDMDKVILAALELCDYELKQRA